MLYLLDMHGEKSTVEVSQLYSGKLQKTFDGYSVLFHPLQFSVLSITKEWRRAHIAIGDTKVALVLVWRVIQKRRLGHVWSRCEERGVFTRFSSEQTLQNCIKTMLEPLAETGPCNFQGIVSNRLRVRVHSILTLFVPNLLKVMSLPLLKRGGSTSYLCHMCLIHGVDLENSICGTPGTLRRVMCSSVENDTSSEKTQPLSQLSMNLLL